MPTWVTTDGETSGGNFANLHGTYYSVEAYWFQFGIGGLTDDTPHLTPGELTASWSQTITTSFDRTYQYKAQSPSAGGATLSFLSFAQGPLTGTPASSAITSSGATISCTFTANVVESTFSVQMQYRKFGDTTWINAGSPFTSGGSASAAISGLLGSTIYEFRLFGTRTTANSTNIVSSTSNFTTLASAPTITTDAASAVASTSANLNGHVNPNSLNVRVRFGWGLSDGGATPGSWTNLTVYQSFSGSTNQSFGQAISGLVFSTTYFFRAFVEWPSPGFASGSSGSSTSFLTAPDPAVEAISEAHMHFPQFDGHYGVATTVYFTLSSPAATSSDRLVTTAPGSLFAAGDIKVIKDGGASANVTNSVSQPTASQPLYALILTATEMQAEVIIVQIVDLNGPAFRDLYLMCRTKERLGQTILNASQIGSSAPAMILQPSSGGYSLDAQDSAGTNIGKIRGFMESMCERSNTAQAGAAGSITLDASAAATDSYYNGDIVEIVGGTGIGQARVITAYAGATKIATVNASWSTNPDSTSRFIIVPGARTMDLAITELAAIPAAGASAGQKLQFCFQRFAFKVAQTAVLQTLYTSAGVSLGTRSVSDDGTTQTVNKVA